MKKIFLSLFLLFISLLVTGNLLAVPLTDEEIIREGQSQLCRLFDLNDEAIRTGHPEEMQFVVQVSEEEPVNYISSVVTPGHTPDPATQSPVKDSLNAKLRKAYLDFGVELYMVLISSLDVVVSTPLEGDISAQKLFTQKLYDEQTNLRALRDKQYLLTNEIINGPISGRNRDCLVLSHCNYCGNFFKNDKQGCFQFVKIYRWISPASQFSDLPQIQNDFTRRLATSNSFIQGNGTYSMSAAADLFYETLAYQKLKANLLHTYTTDSISAILSHFHYSTDYADLTYAEKEHILSVYTGYNMAGDWLLNSNGEEWYVLNVLRYTATEDVPDLLAILSGPSSLRTNPHYNGLKNDKALIVRLIEGTDDAWLMADNNYTELMKIITALMVSNAQVVADHLPNDDAGWLNHQVYWNDTYLFSIAPIGTHSYDVAMADNGTITLQHEVVDRWDVDYNNAAASRHYTAHWDNSYPAVSMQPFDLVMFTNRSSLSMLSMAGAESGQVHVAPAIFLKYADDKQFNSNAGKVTVAVFDLVTAGAGPTLILNAVKASRWGLAAFEVCQFLGGAGNILGNLSNDPDLQAVMEKYNLIVGIWGLSRLTISATKFTSEYLTEARAGNLHPVSPSVASDYRQSFAQAESKLNQLDEATREKLRRMEEYLGEAVAVNDLITRRTNWLNQLKVDFDFNASFIPQGMELDQVSAALKSEMLNGFATALPQNLKEQFLGVLIKSGSTVPVKRLCQVNEELFKIVPKDNIPGKSSFYMTKAEYLSLKTFEDIEKKLGLPLSSHAVEYDVYRAIPNAPVDVFESTVAPTVQGTYLTPGGAKQTFILDVDKWAISKAETIRPPKN